MSSSEKIDEFVRRLSKRRNSTTVFNPYRNSSLADNLIVYLGYMLEQYNEPVLLVGEAPGYKGCRLTGIPFSSGTIIRSSEHKLFLDISPRIHLDKVESENSATVVWENLMDVKNIPLFWNSFPFHPHPKKIQNKNRAPNKKELLEGLGFLAELIEIFQPKKMAGIGRKGTSALEMKFPDEQIVYIRHPSYGGKKDFVSGMEKILN